MKKPDFLYMIIIKVWGKVGGVSVWDDLIGRGQFYSRVSEESKQQL